MPARAKHAARAARAPVPPMPALEKLDRTHRQIMDNLHSLEEMLEHLADDGADERARQIAAKVCVFFTSVARQHHADEERVIFPALLATGNEDLVQHVRRLQQDHGWLETDWIDLSPQLEAVAEGYGGVDMAALRYGIEIFTALYHEHIGLEESLVYPAAAKQMLADQEAAEGRRSTF
jgi:hemerythrin-like domain-containing protein